MDTIHVAKTVIPAIAVIFNEEGKILLSKRHQPEVDEWHDKWQFPGGRIDYGEHPKDTAIRETKEEVGLTIRVLSEYPVVESHVYEKSNVHTICIAYPAEYVSGEIDVSGEEGTSDARWYSYDEIDFSTCLPLTEKILKKAQKLVQSS